MEVFLIAYNNLRVRNSQWAVPLLDKGDILVGGGIVCGKEVYLWEGCVFERDLFL